MTDVDDGAILGHQLSLWVVLYHDALAGRLGVNATEHKILDIVVQQPGITPTQLAEQTGLSQPAITKIVGRLVERSYVARERDGTDGRSFQLAVTPSYRSEVAGILGPMAARMSRLAATLNEDERHAVTRWLTATIEILRESALALRNSDEVDRPDTSEDAKWWAPWDSNPRPAD